MPNAGKEAHIIKLPNIYTSQDTSSVLATTVPNTQALNSRKSSIDLNNNHIDS